MDDRPTIHLPARDIPIPRSVSAEAQAVLSMAPLPAPERPPIEDVDAWRSTIAEHDAAIAAMLQVRTAGTDATTGERDVGGVRVYEIVPHGVEASDRRVYLDIHGGEFIFGAGECCRSMAIGTAARLGARVWSVDYRMPPDHPFPAGLDDCVTVYAALVAERDPGEIIVGGASAGANLAAALILRARDEGLPLPAAAVLQTPAVDLTSSGDSLQTNRGLDPLITDGDSPGIRMYAAGRELTEPHLSPLYGDLAAGFPPTILTTGTRDMLLSDTVRMHRALRAAGVAAELHVTEAGGHGGFFGMAPEDEAITVEVRRFLRTHWTA